MNDTAFEFHFLPNDTPSLPVRLWRELKAQYKEFSANPSEYVKASMANDAIGRKRTKLLLFGTSIAALSLISFLGITLVLYIWAVNEAEANAALTEERVEITMIDPGQIPKIEMPKKAERAGGGGGGGRNEPRPPSRGVLPKASLTPPIVAPSTHPPIIQKPSLPVAPTIQMQPELLPPQQKDLPIGLPTGVVGLPSDGPGSGKGIGTGKGGGVGSGDGTGLGPGRGFNTGGGDPNLGGGDGGPNSPLTAKLQILNRPRPNYTEEGRKNKIQGVVVIEAVFRADGRITSPRVVRGLGYGLDEKAIEAVMQIRFRPAERSGNPVDYKTKVTVSFQLL